MYPVLFLLFALSMLVCHVIAKRKGRNPVAWGISGAILGPLAIVILLLMPETK